MVYILYLFSPCNSESKAVRRSEPRQGRPKTPNTVTSAKTTFGEVKKAAMKKIVELRKQESELVDKLYQ